MEKEICEAIDRENKLKLHEEIDWIIFALINYLAELKKNFKKEDNKVSPIGSKYLFEKAYVLLEQLDYPAQQILLKKINSLRSDILGLEVNQKINQLDCCETDAENFYSSQATQKLVEKAEEAQIGFVAMEEILWEIKLACIFRDWIYKTLH